METDMKEAVLSSRVANTEISTERLAKLISTQMKYRIRQYLEIHDPNLLSKLKAGPFGNDPSQISLFIKNIKISIQPIDVSLSKEATCDIRITASSDACKMTWMKVYYHNTAASPNGYSTEFAKGEDGEIVLKDSSSNTLAYVIPPTAEQMNTERSKNCLLRRKRICDMKKALLAESLSCLMD
jgi:hypothetical protein